MNEYLVAGEKIVQGNRIAGDLADGQRNIVTGWFKAYWLCYSALFSYTRQKLGLSALLTGTGFVAAKEVMKHGWNTSTITEDVEMAVTSCARGYRVAFALEAVCYDEQPSRFSVMMRQLSRWCTGTYQILPRYFSLWLSGMYRPKAVSGYRGAGWCSGHGRRSCGESVLAFPVPAAGGGDDIGGVPCHVSRTAVFPEKVLSSGKNAGNVASILVHVAVSFLLFFLLASRVDLPVVRLETD